MKLLVVVGARPNFMKVAPVLSALARQPQPEAFLVHTGQHQDPAMSDIFFSDLGLPAPDVHLGIGGGSHAQQTGRAMMALEEVALRSRPDAMLVAGDVNSTLAGALVAAKLGLPLAHLEAGLRSFDRSMPEEVNRILTDHVSDLLLTTTAEADRNLLAEGLPAKRVCRVGNPMIDSLLAHLDRARARRMPERLGLKPGRYALCTLHRPSNVDQPEELRRLLSALAELAHCAPVVLPLHPRTRERLAADPQAARLAESAGMRPLSPLGYLDFVGMMEGAAVVLTDSGGVQEETTALGVPCLTLRETTERPVTVELGTNTLVGRDPERIVSEALRALRGEGKRGSTPPLWDGQAGQRIALGLRNWMNGESRG